MAAIGVVTAWQAGYVDVSDVRHAVRPTLSGDRAWCGAGLISRLDPARFVRDSTGSCPACSILVRGGTIPTQRRSDTDR